MDIVFYTVVVSAIIVMTVHVDRAVIRVIERRREAEKQRAALAWQQVRDQITAKRIKDHVAAAARRPVYQGHQVYGVVPDGAEDFGIDGVVYQEDGTTKVLWHDEPGDLGH